MLHPASVVVILVDVVVGSLSQSAATYLATLMGHVATVNSLTKQPATLYEITRLRRLLYLHHLRIMMMMKRKSLRKALTIYLL
jgi:hypothetical protein